MEYLFCSPYISLQQTMQTVVVFAAWLLYLSSMGNMFMQGPLQGVLNCCHIFKNMDTKSGLTLQLKLCLTKKGSNLSIVLDTISFNGNRKAVLMLLLLIATM